MRTLVKIAPPGVHLDVYAAWLVADHLYLEQDFSLDQAIEVSALMHGLTTNQIEQLWKIML